MILEHDGGPGDRRGHGRGVNLGAAGIFRDAQEHGTAAELEVSGSFVEAEDRVRAEARERVVGEREFRPGIDAGAHRRAIAHFIAYRGGPGRGVRGQESDVFDHLADPRLL